MTTDPRIRYDIGQEAWRATFGMTETSIICPDCGGGGRLRVTFDDNTTVSIDCANCSRGYEPPRGRVIVHERKPQAEKVTISGFDVRADEVEYRARAGSSSSWIIDDNQLFDTQEEAMQRAEVLAAEYDREERERISKKEKDTRTWAWNASYHRRAIKRAKTELAYHEGKLAVASLKAKEPAQ